ARRCPPERTAGSPGAGQPGRLPMLHQPRRLQALRLDGDRRHDGGSMSAIGKPEHVTQDRVIALFRDKLGYRYLGDWSDRTNSNIEDGLLAAYLKRRGYSEEQISRALYLLLAEADNANRSLYDNNKAVYERLRYGVQVQVAAGRLNETVHLVDWK